MLKTPSHVGALFALGDVAKLKNNTGGAIAEGGVVALDITNAALDTVVAATAARRGWPLAIAKKAMAAATAGTADEGLFVFRGQVDALLAAATAAGSCLIPSTGTTGSTTLEASFAAGSQVFTGTTPNVLCGVNVDANANTASADLGTVIFDGLTGRVFGSALSPKAATQASLSDSTGSTLTGAIADVTGTFDAAILNGNFHKLTVKLNGVMTVLKDAGLMATS